MRTEESKGAVYYVDQQQQQYAGHAQYQNTTFQAVSPPEPQVTLNVHHSVAATEVVHVGVPVTAVDPLPCGIGVGWFLFILGWFFGIPWYVGVILLIFGNSDPREKPGYTGCAVMAIILTILIVITRVTAH